MSMRIRIRLETLLLLLAPFALLWAAAYIQWATVGLPLALPNSYPGPETTLEPHGFPAWLRITHYVNFLFLILLVRSGLQILMDHPRLYWKVHCTPGTEWLRLTPIESTSARWPTSNSSWLDRQRVPNTEDGDCDTGNDPGHHTWT